MDYALIRDEDIDAADHHLPADSPVNKSILSGALQRTNIFMGCPRWGMKEWRNKIYPKGLKDTNFLDEYVKQYNAIELNATHYNFYPGHTIEGWAAKAKGRNFKFCPKVHKLISHDSNFDNIEKLTRAFIEQIEPFAAHLGPAFLQVSEYFSPKKADQLFRYLDSLPKSPQFFLEVRHPEWFSNDSVRRRLADVLQFNQIGWMITDSLSHREVLHMQLTIPKTFIRFTCQGDHPTDIIRINEWADRIQDWKQQGLEECYFIIHPSNDALSPELTRYVAEKFNDVCDAQLPPVNFVQGTLF